MTVPSITIHQFPPFLGMQPSPFGLKLETWLRMKDLPYELEASFTKTGPKDKIPFATIGGETIGDSEIIIEKISQGLDSGRRPVITDAAEARSVLIRRMIEEHLYFVFMHSRWVDEAGWIVFRPMVFGHLPGLVRFIVARKFRKIVIRNLKTQGISRHSDTEIYAKGAADIAALSAMLGNQPYFSGTEPDLVDACAYGMLANIFYAPLKSPLLEALNRFPNLMAYCDRLRAEFWPNSPRGGGE